MAHGDYDCCAICDRKLDYAGFDAKTKETICPFCVANMAEHGVIVHNVNELIQWINKTDTKKVRDILSDVGFLFCHYLNDVDDAVLSKGIKSTKNRRIQ